MRLAWPEKFSVGFFAFITTILLLLGGSTNHDDPYCKSLRAMHPDWTNLESYCFVTPEQHWSAFLSIEGTLFLKFVLPVWIVLRLIDLYGAGPARRRQN
jgi:hypothetical protein